MTPDDVFAAIADPRRREILDLLAGGEVASGVLADRLPITPGAVSQHLKILREAGLVAVRKEGRRRLYRSSSSRVSSQLTSMSTSSQRTTEKMSSFSKFHRLPRTVFHRHETTPVHQTRADASTFESPPSLRFPSL